MYARSSLLGYLVSSRVYRQLEFLAVGSWWVYTQNEGDGASETPLPHGRLLKVPNGREDVFLDQQLEFKAKRALMKFLRFIGEYEEQTDVWKIADISHLLCSLRSNSKFRQVYKRL